MHEKQNEMQDIWIPKQKHRRELEKETDDLTVNIDSIDREIIDIKKDIEIKKKKIPLLKEEIANLLSTALEKPIEIE